MLKEKIKTFWFKFKLYSVTLYNTRKLLRETCCRLVTLVLLAAVTGLSPTFCVLLKAISHKHVCNITTALSSTKKTFCYQTPQKTRLHIFSFEKCSYSTLSAYLCIASEILSWLNIETNKGIYLLFLTWIRQVFPTYNYHIVCQHTWEFWILW